MSRKTFKQQFDDLFDGPRSAMDWENNYLQNVGWRYLPKCAQDVLNGKDATPAYWRFLLTEYAIMQRDLNAS